MAGLGVVPVMKERLSKRLHPASLSRAVRRMGFSRQKASQRHPSSDPVAQEAFQKRGLSIAVDAAKQAHSDKRITLWFEDEARIGQKGRVCHRWWTRGERPPGLCDQRYTWAHLFGAVQPATGRRFALVMPVVFDRSDEPLPRRGQPPTVGRRARRHGTRPGRLAWRDTFAHTGQHYAGAAAILFARLNPVERLWLYLRERHLSHRLLDDYEAIVDACCVAWNKLTPERIVSLCNYPYIEQVNL
jgi:hypothetical protein